MRAAQVNTDACRAMIKEPDGRSFLMEVRSDGIVNGPFPAGSTHIGFWMQPAQCRGFGKDPGEYPYEPVKEFLLESHWIDKILYPFTIAINSEHLADLRHLAETEFSDVVAAAPNSVVAVFREILLRTPWPEGAATRDIALTGRAAEIFAEAVAKHGHFPPQP